MGASEVRTKLTQLTIQALASEAQLFAQIEATHREPSLFGVTDGKAVGTYLEAKFREYLTLKGYIYQLGNAANGLDFPGLLVDMKVTSYVQPQSSCPFRSLGQKVFGLGYGLLVFVYDKKDDHFTSTAILAFTDVVFVDASRTADFQMTQGLLSILQTGGNEEDLMAFMESRALTTDEYELRRLAAQVRATPPNLGYMTISPALQWRLQYKRVIDKAGTVEGIYSIYKHPRINL